MRIDKLLKSQVSLESEVIGISDSLSSDMDMHAAEVDIAELQTAEQTLESLILTLESTVEFIRSNPDVHIPVGFVQHQLHHALRTAHVTTLTTGLESLTDMDDLTLAMEGLVSDLVAGVDNVYEKLTKRIGDWWAHNSKALLATSGELAQIRRRLKSADDKPKSDTIRVSGLHDIHYKGRTDAESIIRGYTEFVEVQRKVLDTSHQHTLEYFEAHLKIVKKTASVIDRIPKGLVDAVMGVVVIAVISVAGPVPGAFSAALQILVREAYKALEENTEDGAARVSELEQLVSEARENSRQYLINLMRDYAYADKELMGGYIAVLDKDTSLATGGLKFKREGTKADSTQTIDTPTLAQVDKLVDLVIESSEYFRTRMSVGKDIDSLLVKANKIVADETREQPLTKTQRGNQLAAMRNAMYDQRFGQRWFFETVVSLGDVNHRAARSVLKLLEATEKAYKD